MPEDERMLYPVFVENKALIKSKWHPQWGDRQNEIVFIGQELDKNKIVADLQACLLHDDEQVLYHKKVQFKDPFPTNI